MNTVSIASATPDLFPRVLAILRRPGYTLDKSVSHAPSLENGAEAFHIAHEGSASKVVIARE